MEVHLYEPGERENVRIMDIVKEDATSLILTATQEPKITIGIRTINPLNRLDDFLIETPAAVIVYDDTKQPAIPRSREGFHVFFNDLDGKEKPIIALGYFRKFGEVIDIIIHEKALEELREIARKF